jgi:hypothetical protein
LFFSLLEILWNPFDDIVPRPNIRQQQPTASEKKHKEQKYVIMITLSWCGGTFQLCQSDFCKQQLFIGYHRNFSLLSFGDEAEEEEKEAEEQSVKNVKMKSSYAFSQDPTERETAEEIQKKKEQKLLHGDTEVLNYQWLMEYVLCLRTAMLCDSGVIMVSLCVERRI